MSSPHGRTSRPTCPRGRSPPSRHTTAIKHDHYTKGNQTCSAAGFFLKSSIAFRLKYPSYAFKPLLNFVSSLLRSRPKTLEAMTAYINQDPIVNIRSRVSVNQ